MIGVCIVTYNHEAFIAKAIESVLMQEYCGHKVVAYIGNDCSTDKTGEICLEYATKYPENVVFVDNEHNLGLVKNTFALFRKMQEDGCDYIAMLDGDDYWCDTKKLSKQIKCFKENYNCGIVHTNIALQFGDKIDLNIRTNIPSGNVWPCKFAIGNCSVIFKTELLKHIDDQAYVDRKFMSVDYPMYITLSKYTELYFIEDITAVWRRGHSSVSNTNSIQKQIDYLQNGARMWKYLDDLFGIYDATEDNINKWINYATFQIAFDYNDYKLAHSLYKKVNRSGFNFKIKKLSAANKIFFKIYNFFDKIRKVKKEAKYITIEEFKEFLKVL